MVKNILKRTLSTVLVLMLVATTFFIFDPSAVFTTAEASISKTDYNSTDNVTFVVPEAIYLYPVYNAYKASTSSSFKYYVNDSNSWGVTTGEDTQGSMYFYYKNTSSANISFTWESTPGSTLSASSATITFGNTTAKAPGTAYSVTPNSTQVIPITAGTSPSLAAGTTGCYIRWQATFTDSVDGLSKTAYAYTYVYKPYPMPVGCAISNNNERGTNHYASGFGFMSGVHGMYAASDAYPTVNTSNGCVTISGGGAGGSSTNATVLLGSYFKQSADNTNPGPWLSGSSSVSDATMHHKSYSDSGTDGSEYTYVEAHGGYGKISVDSSRYSNFNQIPMLTVGLMVTDDEKSDSGACWFASNRSSYSNSSDFGDYWNIGSGSGEGWFDTAYNARFCGEGSRGSMTASESEGVKFNRHWSKSVSAGEHKLSVGYGNKQGSDRAYDVMNFRCYAYAWSKSDLRTAYANAIKSMNRCNETLLKSAKWTEFYNLFKAVAAQLCKVDQTGYSTVTVNGTSYDTAAKLATALTNAASNYAAQSTTYRDTFTATQKNIKVYDSSGWKYNGTFSDTTLGSWYKGAKLVFSANSYNGYTYKGYRTAAESQTTVGSASSGTASNVTGGDYTVNHATGNTTAYFYYLRNQYTLTYDANGGNSITALSYNIESTNTLPAASGKTGYTFSTWKVTTAAGSWTSGATFNSGTSVKDKYGSATLQAQWTANTYTVTLDQRRGSGGTTSVTATYNANMPSMTKPSRTGYTFGGYYDGTGGSGTQYYKADGTSARTWNKTSDTTLYAKWTAASYTISYDLAGGALPSGQSNPTSFTVTTTPTKLVNPTKNGYTFAGWTGSNGTTAQTDVYVPTNLITNGTTNGYTRTSPYTCSGRDHFWDNEIAVTPGTVYRVFVDGKRTAGSLGMQGGLWYTAQSSGAAYDGYSGVFVTADGDTSSASVSANTWYTFYKDITVPSGKSGGKIYVQLDQNASGGSTSWQVANLRVIKLADACSNKSYTANWSTVSYSITYDLAGGSLASGVTNPTSYTIETNTFTLNNPSKGGYTFSGWTGSNGGTASTSVQVTKGSTGDKNFTANWSANLYTLTFDANGGTAKGQMSYRPTDTATLGDTTKNGYDFVNWKVTTAGGTWTANSTWSSTQSVKDKYGDATLQAQWTPHTYSITYDLAGGSVATANPTTYNITTTTFTLNNPTKTGYGFAGWTGSNGSTAQTTVQVTKGSTGDKTFTAHWSATSYSITYTLNSGTVATANPTSYTIETATFTLNNPTRTGYTFKGWTGTGLSAATMTVTITKGSTGARSYTATWEANTITMTFNENGGTWNGWNSDGSSASQYADTKAKNVKYDGQYGAAVASNKKWPKNPTRTGYDFQNWTADGTASGKVYTSTGTVNETANFTVKAYWKVHSYTINYTMNGGTNSSSNPSSYTINSSNITLADATKTGYTFTGWTGNGTTTPTKNLVLPAGSTGDKTFTANWSAISYTITYAINPSTLTGITWGGTTVTANPNKTSYTVETAAFTLTNPQRAGYTFNGWTGANGTTAQTTVTVTPGTGTTSGLNNVRSNLSFTANFTVQSYTLTFIPDGGTFKAEGGFSSGTSNQTKSITYGSTYGAADGNNKTWPTIERTGYTFGGWKNGSTTYTATTTVSVTASHNVTAQWSATKYTITINYDGGSASPANPTEYYYTSNAITLTQPTRTGYTFQGYTGTGLSQATKSVTIPAGSTGNRSYTATWTTVSYNITYNLPTGATNAAGNPSTYTIESAAITLADASKTGWTFNGWTGNGTTTATKNLVLPHGSTGDKTFTANFTAKKFTITLDSKLYNNAGEFVSDATSAGTGSVTATYDSAMPSATMPQLTGYTFGGYYDTKGGSGNQYYKAGGGSNKNWDKTNNNGTGYTLYAKWTINSSTLKVDPNGGTWSGSTNVQTFTGTYGSKKAIAVPSWSGYSFTGWTKSGDGNGTWDASSNEFTYGSLASKTDILTAGWNAIKYTITYDYDGGGVSTANPTEYYVTTADFTLNQPTKTGYTFAGYTGTGLSQATKVVTVTQGSTGNRNYTATWTANKVDLTFNPNGGYFTTDANGFTTGTNQTGQQSKQVTYDSTYGAADASGKTWPNVARTGYTFQKWTSDGTSSGTEYKSTGSVTITSAKTIYAYWTAKSYDITCTVPTGTTWPNGTNPTSYTIESDAITLKNPARTGYTFTGWTGSNGTTAQTTVTIAHGSTGNKSYTANWSTITYTITYDLKDGNLPGNQTNPGTYTIETATFTLKNPVKTGYDFKGWNGGVVGGTQSTSMSVQITLGSTGNRKYTATWQAKEYTVALNMQGGEGGTEQVTATFDAAMPAIDLPAKDGYDFAGYWTGTNGTGTDYYDGNGDSARNWNIDSTSTTTLYAKWEPHEFTITFQPNGGGNVYNNNTLGYNIESTAKLVASTRGGYEFNGWKPTADAGNWLRNSTYAGGNGTTTGFSLEGMWGNVTLQAQWRAAQYTITYNSNGGETTPSAQNYTINTNLSLAADPGRTGYDFQGWTPQAAVGNWSTTNTYIGSIGTGKYGNVTLVAQWTAQTYTLTFMLDGGSLTAGGGFTANQDGQTKTVTYNSTYGATFDTNENKSWPNNPTKLGYDFGGWKNGNTTFTSGGTVTITEDTEITAKWTIKSYNVTVNTANSGTATSGYGMASVATGVANPANYNSTVTLQYTASAGYQFKNWSSNDVTVNSQNKFTMPAKAVTVTANFEPITYTITYNLNEGTVATANPTTYTIETPSFSLNNPEKTGYTFKGWTGSNSQNTPETTVTIANSTGNLSYVANWTPNKYNVTLERQGGTGGTTGVQATFGAAMPAATKPSKNGYDFAGYYKNDDGTGTQYYDANCASAHVWDIAAASTIYAKWVIKTYNITYTLAGGSVTPENANPATYQITDADITLVNPTRTGYTFAGWTGTGLQTAMTTVVIPNGSYGDRAYTATWNLITYTITYDLAGGSLASGVTNPDSYTIETPTFTLNNPGKNGYDFYGWKGGVDGTTPTTASTVRITLGSTGNRSYVATYTPRSYTLNFVSDGDDQDIDSLPYKPDDTFTLGDTTKVGHTFAGWEVTQSTSTPTTWTMGSVWSAVTSVEGKYGNATLTATWTVNNYTLTVDPTGGTFNSTTDPSNFTQAYGTTKSLGAASRNGYTFEGWQKVSGKGTYAANSNPKTGGTFTYGAGAGRLEAQWTAITYTITYTYGVGEGSVTNPGTYTIETSTITLNNPSADGYTFDGWSGTDLGATTKTVKITQGSTGNRSYTANWSKNSYTVTLDRQGGTTGTVEVSATYNEAMPSASMPTRDGYDFKGYYASPNGVGTQYYTAGGNSANVWDQADNSTIYAYWTAQTYTLTFFPAGGYFDVDTNNNGGGFETGEDKTNYQTKQVTYGGHYGDRDSSGKTWPANMTYPGHTFSGWKSGNTTFTAAGEVTITGNTNLTAQWTKKTFTVAFDMNGVSASVSPATKTLSYNTSNTYAPTPTKTDATDAWVFRGWSTSAATTSGTVAAQGSTISATTVNGWFNDVGEGGTKTVYAIWQKTLTGTFKDGRGDDMVATVNIYNGATSGQITIPAQRDFAGWTKMGWTTSTSNTATADNTSTKFTITASTITTENTDVKYYGRYDRTVAVTYNPNGGDTTPNPTSVTQQTNGYNINNWTYKTVTLASAITRGGYTFDGWLIGSDTYVGGDTYTITGNVEAVAQWTLNDFTVTIDPNEGSVSSITYYSGGTTSGNLQTAANVTESTALTTVHGTTMTLALPTRNGYAFTGWEVTATAPGGDLPADGVITNSSLAESTYLVGAADVTLTATWNARQYVLRYASSRADNLEVVGGTFAYDEEVTVADWDVLENDYPGYVFTNWTISVSTEGDTYVAGDTFTLSNFGVTFDGLSLDANGNPVVYMTAEWVPASYQIRYDTNGFAANAIKSTGKKTTWRWEDYASGDYLQKGGDGVAALSGAYSDAEFGIGSYYYVSTATDVRFGLGWSFDPNATEPDIEFLSDLTIDDIDDSVLANAELIDEESHLYELTLYMIWSANYKPLEDSVAAFQRAYMTFPDSGNTTIRNTRYTGSQASKALYVSGATSGLLPTLSIADNAYKPGGSEANELWNNDSTAPDYALYNWVPGTFGNSNSWLTHYNDAANDFTGTTVKKVNSRIRGVSDLLITDPCAQFAAGKIISQAVENEDGVLEANTEMMTDAVTDPQGSDLLSGLALKDADLDHAVTLEEMQVSDYTNPRYPDLAYSEGCTIDGNGGLSYRPDEDTVAFLEDKFGTQLNEMYPDCEDDGAGGHHSFNSLITMANEIFITFGFDPEADRDGTDYFMDGSVKGFDVDDAGYVINPDCVYTTESVYKLFDLIYGRLTDGTYKSQAADSFNLGNVALYYQVKDLEGNVKLKCPSWEKLYKVVTMMAYGYHSLEMAKADYSEFEGLFAEYFDVTWGAKLRRAGYNVSKSNYISSFSTYFTEESYAQLSRFVSLYFSEPGVLDPAFEKRPAVEQQMVNGRPEGEFEGWARQFKIDANIIDASEVENLDHFNFADGSNIPFADRWTYDEDNDEWTFDDSDCTLCGLFCDAIDALVPATADYTAVFALIADSVQRTVDNEVFYMVDPNSANYTTTTFYPSTSDKINTVVNGKKNYDVWREEYAYSNAWGSTRENGLPAYDTDWLYKFYTKQSVDNLSRVIKRINWNYNKLNQFDVDLMENGVYAEGTICRVLKDAIDALTPKQYTVEFWKGFYDPQVDTDPQAQEADYVGKTDFYFSGNLRMPYRYNSTVNFQAVADPYNLKTFNGWNTMKNTLGHHVSTQADLYTVNFKIDDVVGWGQPASGSPTAVVTTTDNVNYTITLYAEWVDNVTLDIDMDGGTAQVAADGPQGTTTFTATANANDAGNHPTFDYRTTLTFSEMAKEGYQFDRWVFQKGANNTASTMNGNVYTFGYGSLPRTNDTLLAKWTSNPYTVTFHANYTGATQADYTQSFRYDVAQTLTPNAFTRSGWRFTNWVDSNGVEYTDEQSVSNLTTQYNGNVDLYAEWEVADFTLTFKNEFTLPDWYDESLATFTWAAWNGADAANDDLAKTITSGQLYGKEDADGKTWPSDPTISYVVTSEFSVDVSFDGWWTQKDSGGTKIDATSTVTVTEDQNLYPHFNFHLTKIEKEELHIVLETLNANLYTIESLQALDEKLQEVLADDHVITEDDIAAIAELREALVFVNAETGAKEGDFTPPTVSMFENKAALQQAINDGTIVVTDENAADIEYMLSESTGETSYIFPGKAYYTYYCYTNSENPAILLNASEVLGESGRVSYPVTFSVDKDGTNSKNQIRTRSGLVYNGWMNYSQDVTDPEAEGYNPNRSAGYHVGTNYLENPYQGGYELQYVGRDYDNGTGYSHYMYEQYILLKPTFEIGAGKQYALYTFEVTDDSIGNLAASSANVAGATNTPYGTTDLTATSNEDVTPTNTITIFVEYYNTMNGYDGDAGGQVVNASTGIGTSNGNALEVYNKFHENGYQNNVWVNNDYLYRNACGAANGDFITPVFKADGDDAYDAVYVANDPVYGQTDVGSFYYLMKSDDAATTLYWDAYDAYIENNPNDNDVYHNARVAGANAALNQVKKDVIKDMQNPAVREKMNNTASQGARIQNGDYVYWPYTTSTQWSTQFYAPARTREDTLVYVHIYDRWGNHYTNILQRDLQDTQAATANVMTRGEVTINELGGSGVSNITFYELNTKKKVNVGGQTDGQTWNVVDNQFTITGLPQGSNDFRYTMVITDNAGGEQKVNIQANADGTLLVTVNDETMGGSYADAANGSQPVNGSAIDEQALNGASVAVEEVSASEITIDAIPEEQITGEAAPDAARPEMYTFTVNDVYTVNLFADSARDYEVTLQSNAGGTVKAYVNGTYTAPQNGKITVPAGSHVQIRLSANTGYELQSLTMRYSDGRTVDLVGAYDALINDDVTISAVFAETAALLKIRVENGAVSGKSEMLVSPNSRVTVVADTAPDGMVFAYWTQNGGEAPVSYDSIYTFIATSSIDLTANYAEEPIEKTANIEMDLANPAQVTLVNGKYTLAYSGRIVLPEGAQIEEFGMVLTNQSADSCTAENFVIGGTVNGKNVAKLVGQTVTDENQCMINVNNVAAGQTRTGRLYMTVRFADGTTQTFYSSTWAQLDTPAA